jgi:glycyl-tRNA synthetase beta chain
MEDAIPRGRTGQIVSLADKLDTLRGCFGVGMIPTGSRDPFALRRAAQGIVKIVVEGKLEIDLEPFLEAGAEDKTAALREFVEDRVRYYFKDIRGFKYDEVNAAMAAGWSKLVDLEARLERIQGLRASADFEPLAASFKRIQNILDQAMEAGIPFGQAPVDEALLEPGPEKDLYEEQRRIAGQPIESVIARLRPKVDLFFDKVLVNAPDARVRQNRLTLLNTLLEEFSSIADFSEIVTNS